MVETVFSIISNLAPDKFANTEEEAPHPLIQVKTVCGEGVATKFNNNYLQHHSSNPDKKEDPIAKDPTEDVTLTMNFTSIKLIEESHQYKGIEDGCKVLSRFRNSISNEFACAVTLQYVLA